MDPQPTTKRQCRKCGETKPINAYSRNRSYSDGLDTLCKTCANAYQAKYRAEHKGKTPQKEVLRRREAVRRWRRRNLDKAHAHQALKKQVRKGKIIPAPCESCGSTNRVHGHHDSYAREDRLKVRWLCAACHARWHAKQRITELR